MRLITERSELPDCIRDIKEVAGISVGGCVCPTGGLHERHCAHAHETGAHAGWICVQTEHKLTNRLLLIHEAAHCIAKSGGHDDKWRQAVVEIGGTFKPYSFVNENGSVGFYPDYSSDETMAMVDPVVINNDARFYCYCGVPYSGRILL